MPGYLNSYVEKIGFLNNQLIVTWTDFFFYMHMIFSAI